MGWLDKNQNGDAPPSSGLTARRGRRCLLHSHRHGFDIVGFELMLRRRFGILERQADEVVLAAARIVQGRYPALRNNELPTIGFCAAPEHPQFRRRNGTLDMMYDEMILDRLTRLQDVGEFFQASDHLAAKGCHFVAHVVSKEVHFRHGHAAGMADVRMAGAGREQPPIASAAAGVMLDGVV
jgi:hypothetical protein